MAYLQDLRLCDGFPVRRLDGMDDATPAVAVLGLGRMGSAMAVRLAPPYAVAGWSRSGRDLSGVVTASTPAEAVSDAEVVVLSLFDAAACRAVLARCLPAISPAAAVVNTSTVGPAEAEELAGLVHARGAAYVHAPVQGSVPAVESGTLTVLASGDRHAAAREVLSRLGVVVEHASIREAAAAKLVGNGVLAELLRATRRSLDRGDRLGLDGQTTLDALERSPLGRLVAAKRHLLAGGAPGATKADFTIAALRKDLELLAKEAGTVHPLSGLIEDLTARKELGTEDDIAALCVAGLHREVAEYADARLTVAPDVTASAEVLAPLHAYALGHATGNAAHFRRAFQPTAQVEGMRDGAFVSWDLETYCALFTGRPAPDEPTRSRVVDTVTVVGTVASAVMTLRHGADTFTDMFVLIEGREGWRIANKVYHRG